MVARLALFRPGTLSNKASFLQSNDSPGHPGWRATQGSHRSVRARSAHTARHSKGSRRAVHRVTQCAVLLRERQVSVSPTPLSISRSSTPSRIRCRRSSFANSAIRCCRVDTVPSFDALAMFPANGSLLWHPLPSTGSSRTEFACFVGTMRCSDLLPPVSPRFVSFAWRYPPRASVFAPFRPDADRGPWSFRVWQLHAKVCGGGTAGSPRFLENPVVPMPCSRTPVGSTHPGHNGTPTRPPLATRRRLPHCGAFRG